VTTWLREDINTLAIVRTVSCQKRLMA